MNALHPRELGTSFRGLTALVLEKRRTLVRMPLWLGLPAGVFASFVARVKHAEPLDLAILTTVALVLSAVLGPLMATSAVTLSGNQMGARSRRDELLALPLGRLAIPGGTLANAVLVWISTYVAFLVGLTFFLGKAKVLGAVFTPPIDNDFPFTVAGRFGGAACLFVAFWSLLTVSHGANLVLVFFVATGALVGFLPGTAGYSELEMVLHVKLWTASLALFALAQPFVLYARSPHHWAGVRVQASIGKQAQMNTVPQGPAGCSALVAALALFVLGYVGMGKAVVVVLLVGGFFMRRTWKKLKAERRLPSHVAVALGLVLAFVTPVVTFGLVTDARRLAEAARPSRETLERYALAPDGRHVAASFHQNLPAGMTRVLVFDVSGKEAPRVLPPRSASLEPASCWSRDGRYLAVHEAALGRICLTGDALRAEHVTWGSDVFSVDEFMERQAFGVAHLLQGTWILDTQTGALSEKDVLTLAPGWSEPQELVSIVPCSLGGAEIQDGRGRKALWERPDLAIDAYTDSGPELLCEHERFVLGAQGVAPVDTSARWGVEIGAEHTTKGTHPSLAKQGWDYTFVKGEKKLVVKDNFFPSPTWIGPSSVLLFGTGAKSGYYRLDLETGERLDLGHGERPGLIGAFSTWTPGLGVDAPRFVGRATSIASSGGGFALLDLETGTERPLPSFEGFAPRAVQGSVVLGELDGKLAASEGGSAPKPLF